MDNKTIAKFVVFLLVWVNALLAQNHIKQIPLVDEGQVALWIAFAYSAYEWAKHVIKWMRANWFQKQPAVAPAAVLPSTPVPTPTAADLVFPAATTATPSASPQTAAAPETATPVQSGYSTPAPASDTQVQASEQPQPPVQQ